MSTRTDDPRGWIGEGPGVQIANAESLFPHLLSNAWRQRGVPSLIVTGSSAQLPREAAASQIVDAHAVVSPWYRRLQRATHKPLLPLEQWVVRRFGRRFTRRTGLPHPQAWEYVLLLHVYEAVVLARAARALRPGFVFAHEVTSHGLAAALCGRVPKILFPWGGDVFSTAEVSPFHFALVKRALHAADLVVPSSEHAAQHITARFGVPPARVRAISWGVELGAFQPADRGARERICRQWSLDPDHRIVMNVRRFLPLWNAGAALEAFMQVAGTHPSTHFVLLGGHGTEEEVARAEIEVRAHALQDRFTFLRGHVPLSVVAALMSISDVGVSLIGCGDMRSKSVLQACGAGAVPVLSRNPEYLLMRRHGFDGMFVDPASAPMIAAAIRRVLDDPEEADRIRRGNFAYLREHEDAELQMDELLDAVRSTVQAYRS